MRARSSACRGDEVAARARHRQQGAPGSSAATTATRRSRSRRTARRAVGSPSASISSAWLPCMISVSRATHGTLSSRMFQTSPSTPPERSTRADLSRSRGRLDPVPCLAEQTASTLASGSGSLSADPTKVGTPWTFSRSVCEHLRVGVDGDDLGAQLTHRAGELARSRADIGDADAALTARDRLEHPVDRLDRVVGSPGLVRLRFGPEGHRHLFVAGHGSNLTRLHARWTAPADRPVASARRASDADGEPAATLEACPWISPRSTSKRRTPAMHRPARSAWHGCATDASWPRRGGSSSRRRAMTGSSS